MWSNWDVNALLTKTCSYFWRHEKIIVPGALSVNTVTKFPKRGEDRLGSQCRECESPNVWWSEVTKTPTSAQWVTMEILCTSSLSINFPRHQQSWKCSVCIVSCVWGLNHNVTGAPYEPAWMTCHPLSLYWHLPVSPRLFLESREWLSLPISGRMGVPSPEEALSPSSGIAHAEPCLPKLRLFHEHFLSGII